MGELTPIDVQNYTQGRLDDADPETARMLTAALAAARRYCGWPVTPPVTSTVVLDGPGARLLVLPTLKLSALTAVVEDGVSLNVANLYWSTRGLVRKRNGACWSRHYGAITVTMTHGFTEASAEDWRAAVLSSVDTASQAAGGGVLKVIGPFQFETDSQARERSTFDLYALELAP